MITRDQFQLQVDRLCDCFGDRHFPDQRVRMIWDSAEGNEYQTVIAIVDGFIRSSKHAPLPADFSEAINEATKGSKRKYALGELQPREIAKCQDCLDSGFIRLNSENVIGSAPCHCHRGKMLIEAGKRKNKNPINLGPQFNETWLKGYTIEPYCQTG